MPGKLDLYCLFSIPGCSTGKNPKHAHSYMVWFSLVCFRGVFWYHVIYDVPENVERIDGRIFRNFGSMQESIRSKRLPELPRIIYWLPVGWNTLKPFKPLPSRVLCALTGNEVSCNMRRYRCRTLAGTASTPS